MLHFFRPFTGCLKNLLIFPFFFFFSFCCRLYWYFWLDRILFTKKKEKKEDEWGCLVFAVNSSPFGNSIIALRIVAKIVNLFHNFCLFLIEGNNFVFIEDEKKREEKLNKGEAKRMKIKTVVWKICCFLIFVVLNFIEFYISFFLLLPFLSTFFCLYRLGYL